MYYKLNRSIGLRSFELVPYCYYRKHERNASKLSESEFNLLLKCDSFHDIEDSDLLRSLMYRGFILPCEKGERPLNKWQYKKCDNRYFPSINWMITGKCNYNCLHCFNAKDNERLQSEFSYEEAIKLIEEAEVCGVNAFTITGGEPMLHSRFIDIVKSIYDHDMYIEELNTNGYFITQNFLDSLKEIGCKALIKISFDGVGHHDYLRNRKGAEEDALRAIRLCVDNGFRVKVQTNVHRLNKDTMIQTAILLDSLGVEEMRIIRTTESPRWVKNASGACLSFDEYFDFSLSFLKEYTKLDLSMQIDIWQFVHLWSKNKVYRLSPVECSEGEYRDSLPVCRGNRGMVAISSDGNLYPCHQMSGYYRQNDWFLGNVKENSLQSFLKSSNYLNTVCTTVKDLKNSNSKCNGCKWFKYCCGGCRTIGVVLTGDKMGSDISKCIFFENDYINKINNVMVGYRNISIVI